ncbi:hypothetical protein [Brevibacillus daliensis]|uniref:hypothetical protein n=1 Tax=Brevibacillus daliensis TaxID=2892995 RepID=UPI001E540068|nr:hypothetical protein [Brevibacillus daliensis]
MDAVNQLVEKINDWAERLLLKGLAKLDERDIEEIHGFMESAKDLDMMFLVRILEGMATEGRRYVMDSQTVIDGVVQKYFYLCQYVQLVEEKG